MARMKLTKEQQIKGCRKALANPRTPKQFLPGLRKRLKKLLAAAVATVALMGCSARPARAQFIGYTSPQTVQQTLASNVSCTGSSQLFSPSNLGQTQHYVTVTPASNTTLSVKIMGQDVNGNNIQISDAIFPATAISASNLVTGTGYFAKIVVIVNCSGGSFSLTYSGASSSPNVNAGSFSLNQLNKSLFTAAPTNTTVGATNFITPFGSSYGKLVFAYNTAGIAGSSLQVICQSGGVAAPYQTWNFPLANTTAVQVFEVPDFECPFLLAQYTSGGASANTYNWDYVFDLPGRTGNTTSAASLTSAQNLGALLTEKGARWGTQTSSPGAGSQATTTKAAGTNGTRHVADCITWSAGATTAPAATLMSINLRDGASGAGTVLWQTQVTAGATATQHGQGYVCGLNLIGSANTAMTLEFNALVANEAQSVALTGYDVQ